MMNANGKKRPWFRFWLTLNVMAVAMLLVHHLFDKHDEISNMIAMLIGIIVNKVADALGQAFNWWFSTENEDESQNTIAIDAPPPPPQRTLPDDY